MTAPGPAWTRALVDLFLFPRSCFRIVRDSAPWVGLLIVLSASSIGLSLWIDPYLGQLARVGLPADAPPEQIQQLEQVMRLGNLARIVLAPIIVLVGWLAVGLMIWLLVVACEGGGAFSRAFSVAAHTSLIAHVYSWFAVLVLSFRGVEAVQSAADLQPALGLDLFLSSEQAGMRALLGSVNLFGLWYLTVLALGVSLVFGSSRLKSLFIAGTCWGSIVGFQALLAGIASSLSPS